MKALKSILSVIIGIIIIIGALTRSFHNEPFRQQSDAVHYEIAEIVRVKDGDTLLCKFLETGENDTVRLIGINTPESVHEDEEKNTIYGDMASDYTKAMLPKGTIVYLVSDVEDVDQYNRKLRYVYLDKSLETMVNAILLREGYCTTMRIKPNVAFADEFYQLMEEAKEQERGLWQYEEFKSLQYK